MNIRNFFIAHLQRSGLTGPLGGQHVLAGREAAPITRHLRLAWGSARINHKAGTRIRKDSGGTGERALSKSPAGLTELLSRARDGEKAASAAVAARVHDQLRRIAAAYFARERAEHTLQPTAIVNEAWARLLGTNGRLDVPDLDHRGQFFAIAARAMRRVLVEHARAHHTRKRGAGRVKLTIDVRDVVAAPQPTDVLAIHDALQRLEEHRPRAAQVVELRYFAGCTIEETADSLAVSPETVKNDWRFAKAWLKRELATNG